MASIIRNQLFSAVRAAIGNREKSDRKASGTVRTTEKQNQVQGIQQKQGTKGNKQYQLNLIEFEKNEYQNKKNKEAQRENPVQVTRPPVIHTNVPFSYRSSGNMWADL